MRNASGTTGRKEAISSATPQADQKLELTTSESISTTIAQPYSFPFPPYPSQLDLMNSIYSCINNGNVGCFESPTGTGKSLSTICAAFTWLREEENRILQHIQDIKDNRSKTQSAPLASSVSEDIGDWLTAYVSDYEKKRTHSSITSDNPTQSKIEGISDESSLLDSLTMYQDLLKRIHNAPLNAKQRSKLLEQARAAYVRQHVQPSSSTSAAGKIKSDNMNDNDEEEDECLIRYVGDDDFETDSLHHNQLMKEGNKNNIPVYNPDALDEEEDLDDTLLYQRMHLPRIIYCSRTHSQLSQFMQEIRKTIFHDMRCVTLGSRRNLCINPSVMMLSSDAAMNEKCLEMMKNGRKSTATQTSKKPRTTSKPPKITSCAYKQRSLEQQLSLQVLHHAQDVEELLQTGKAQDTCSYFAAKEAVRFAQVIAVPYTILLHPDIRASFQLNIAHPNTVVIIDEAHNLVDAIAQSHSADITPAQLTTTFDALQQYMTHYQTRLHSKTLYFLTLLQTLVKKVYMFLTKHCMHYLQQQSQSDATATAVSLQQVLTVNDVLLKAGMDHVNLFAMRRFLSEADMVPRIAAFAQRQLNTNKNNNNNSKGNANVAQQSLVGVKGDLQAVVSFFTCLTFHDNDGRVFILPSNNANNNNNNSNRNSNSNATNNVSSRISASQLREHKHQAEALLQTLSIKYQLLSTASRFTSIVQQAKSVILLGGTMQPFHYFTSTILQSVASSPRLQLFSCGHIIDKTQLLPLLLNNHRYSNPNITDGNANSINNTTTTANTINNDVVEITWDFTHERRHHRDMTDALADCLCHLFTVTPRGIVVFFPSYQYLEFVVRRWQKEQPYFWQRLNQLKPIYYETRNNSANNNYHITTSSTNNSNVWESYCREMQHAQAHHPQSLSYGAALFSVLGGRLSEGINFSDDLARAVVVVGMPYPDTRDIVLQEKMKNYHMLPPPATDIPASSITSNTTLPSLPELLCMRTVNQAIGRAIRHHRDFASVILLDQRYLSHRILAQLPQWMRQSLPPSPHGNNHMLCDYVHSIQCFYQRNNATFCK